MAGAIWTSLFIWVVWLPYVAEFQLKTAWLIKPITLIRRRFASMRWHTRITLWVAATIAGLLVVMFARLADMALAPFDQQTTERPWLPFICTPLIGMLIVWLTTRFLSVPKAVESHK